MLCVCRAIPPPPPPLASFSLERGRGGGGGGLLISKGLLEICQCHFDMALLSPYSVGVD